MCAWAPFWGCHHRITHEALVDKALVDKALVDWLGRNQQ